MKRNDLQDLKSKSVAELEALLADNRERIRSLQFDLALGKVKNLSELRKLKKANAVILTLMNAQVQAT